MTDAFANLVSPVFQHVIEFQRRLGEGEAPPLGPELERILSTLAEAERRAGPASSPLGRDFELAKHALVYWIDEVLINSHWVHATEYKEHALEFKFYRVRVRATRFFEKALEAEILAGTDPLETFFLCVALGFWGRFRDERGEEDRPGLAHWADRVYGRILAGSPHPDKFRADDTGPHEPLRPLPGKSALLAVCLMVSATVLFTLAGFVLAFPPRS